MTLVVIVSLVRGHSSLVCWWAELAWLGPESIREGSGDGRAARRRWCVGGLNLPGLAQGAFARGSGDGRAVRHVRGLVALHVRRFHGPPLRLRLSLMWAGIFLGRCSA